MKGLKTSEVADITVAEDTATLAQSSGLTGLLKSVFGVAVMSTVTNLTGCAATNAGQEAILKAEIHDLQQTLAHCQERSLEDNGAPVIIGYGTFGITLFRPGVPNNLLVPRAFQGEMQVTMLIWPPALKETDIKMEGNPSHLRLEKIDTNWAVVFKTDLATNKESVVIDVNGQRYVLLVVKK